MAEKDNNIKKIESGHCFTIKDEESGSKAIMPVIVDKGYEADVIKVDNGILKNLKDRERACDFALIINSENEKEKITCMTELKGTGNDKEINHAFDQIRQSICRISDYIENSDYLIAVIAGTSDKTLPRMINQKNRELCKQLLSKSRKKVSNMNKLIVYIQPKNGITKATLKPKKSPCVIECHSKRGSEIPIPSLLIEAVEGK